MYICFSHIFNHKMLLEVVLCLYQDFYITSSKSNIIYMYDKKNNARGSMSDKYRVLE